MSAIVIGAAVVIAMFVPFVVWRARRTRDLLHELATQRALGRARAWIDETFPSMPAVNARTMRQARERFCALALADEHDALDRELARVAGEGGWRVVAVATGRFAQVVRGGDPEVAAVKLRAFAHEAAAHKSAWIDPTAAITPLVELVDAILADRMMVRTGTLARISMADPMLRTVIEEGLAYTGPHEANPVAS